MFKQFVTVYKKYVYKTPKTALGRWEHRITDKHRDLKIIWANADHCGDVICGKPKDIAKNIDYIQKKYK